MSLKKNERVLFGGFPWIPIFLAGCAGAWLIGACVLAGADLPKSSPALVAKVDFTQQVRPILASHCFKCHGQDEGARKAKMRLDVRDDAIKPAKSDEVPIVPDRKS